MSDFSYDLGLVRENFGISSFDYGTWAGSGTYRYGITDQWTGELRGEAQSGLANVGVASDVLIGNFGTFSGSLAGGRSHSGFGTRIPCRLSTGNQRSISFSIQATWISPHFRQMANDEPQFAVAHEWIASAGYTFGRFGTIAGAYDARA